MKPQRLHDLNRHEAAVSKIRDCPAVLKTIVSGTSRVSRLSKVEDTEPLQTIWETGADVIGPIFFFFIWSVLEQAKKDNIKRLYFLSRDGEIFLKIANQINEKWNYPIECRYLYCSRQLWFLPSVGEVGAEELTWIASLNQNYLPLNNICQILNMNKKDVTALLKPFDLNHIAWDKNLSQSERLKLRECFSTEAAKKLILENSEEHLDAIVQYLKQEGMLDDSHFALVDIGWRGNLQHALSQILQKRGLRPADGIKGFYFGLSEDKRVYKNDQLSSFLFDLSKSLKNCLLRSNHLMESFAASNQKRTINLSNENGRLSPIFDESQENENCHWGIDTQQESILKFAEIFINCVKADLLNVETLRPIAETLLCEFIRNPSWQEAHIYGKHIFSGGVDEKRIKEIAPVLKPKQWFSFLTTIRSLDHVWAQGTAVRSHIPFRQIVGLVHYIKSLLRILVLRKRGTRSL